MDCDSVTKAAMDSSALGCFFKSKPATASTHGRCSYAQDPASTSCLHFICTYHMQASTCPSRRPRRRLTVLRVPTSFPPPFTPAACRLLYTYGALKATMWTPTRGLCLHFISFPPPFTYLPRAGSFTRTVPSRRPRGRTTSRGASRRQPWSHQGSDSPDGRLPRQAVVLGMVAVVVPRNPPPSSFLTGKKAALAV